jgi:hypothetical protein
MHDQTQIRIVSMLGHSKTLVAGHLPLPLCENRHLCTARTVADPLEDYYVNEILPLLEKDRALQAVTLLRHLQSEHPLDRNMSIAVLNVSEN